MSTAKPRANKAPVPPPPPRENRPRAKAKPPGTWRRELHKPDCPDPLACPGCSRAAAQKGTSAGADFMPASESQVSSGGAGDEDEEVGGLKDWEAGLTDVHKFNHAMVVAVALGLSTVDEVRGKVSCGATPHLVSDMTPVAL